MTTLTQGIQPGEFLMSEANGTRSREAVTVTVASSAKLPSGTVLGKITASGKYVVYANGASDGSEAAAAVLLTELQDGVNGDYPATVIVRDAEVIGDRLDWKASDGTAVTAGKADLKALGIIVR